MAWPMLVSPPGNLLLSEDGLTELVPFEYWISLVKYLAEVDTVRMALVRQGVILPTR